MGGRLRGTRRPRTRSGEGILGRVRVGDEAHFQRVVVKCACISRDKIAREIQMTRHSA
jgi:hypothetical protein